MADEAKTDFPDAPVRNDDARASRLLGLKEIFDRIGYGATAPQLVSVLFWIMIQANPLGLFLVGILTGAKALLSVVWSNILSAYARLAKVPKAWIASSGIAFGFLFILMALALLTRNIWLFSSAFLLSALCIVAYGDLYGSFESALLRKERRSTFLRGIATWGVLITAVTMLLSGFLLDAFPATGTPVVFSFLGKTYGLQLYGHLLAFEITAFAFIFSGYVTSFIRDTRVPIHYPLGQFIAEYLRITRSKTSVFVTNSRVFLLTLASVILAILQTVLTAYAGIALYRVLAEQYPTTPFFALVVVLSIAAVAAFTGPFFTQRAHRATGLAPTLVFGTLLMTILPVALIYKTSVAILAAALCANVIGASIVGFAQGLLAHKFLPDDRRADYFQAQWVTIVIPYLVVIPILSWVANGSLTLLFWITAIGLVGLVLPLFFSLVVMSEKANA